MPKMVKGMTLNPNGRPIGSISYKNKIMQAFLDLMEKEVQVKDSEGNETGETAIFYDAFLERFMTDALSGKFAAQQFFAERLLKPDILETVDTYINRGAREDNDFLSYRIYKECHDIQQQILLSKSKYIYLMAGRRSGKSAIDDMKGTEKAITKSDARVLYIGLSFTRCLELFWIPIQNRLKNLGIKPKESRRTEGLIILPNNSEIHFVGNTTVDERDKLRGSQWDLIIIDEAQSQKALAILTEEILEPTLIDRKGQMMFSGTGPKIRGTYWESLWSDVEKHRGARFNWSIMDNPFIPDYQTVLEEIKAEKGLTDTSPLFIREYMGKICYDDDALVYRLGDANYFTDADIPAWINSQPITDIKFTAGLDYGFEDSDAFCIVMFSSSKPERFLLYEYKGNRTGVTELAEAMKKGIAYIENHPALTGISNKFFYIYADTAGGVKKISSEFNSQFNLPVIDAKKDNKDLAVEVLQDEVRRAVFKVRPEGIFADESLKTVFARNERDELTRIIDDDAFHPDMVDALLYSMRFVWINYLQK
jgi:hypothetical protein